MRIQHESWKLKMQLLHFMFDTIETFVHICKRKKAPITNSFYLHAEILYIFHFTQLLTTEKMNVSEENVWLIYFFEILIRRAHLEIGFRTQSQSILFQNHTLQSFIISHSLNRPLFSVWHFFELHLQSSSKFEFMQTCILLEIVHTFSIYISMVFNEHKRNQRIDSPITICSLSNIRIWKRRTNVFFPVPTTPKDTIITDSWQFLLLYAWTIATISKISNGIQCLKWKLTKFSRTMQCRFQFNFSFFFFSFSSRFLLLCQTVISWNKWTGNTVILENICE